MFVSFSHTRNADALSCRKIIGVAHAKTGGFGSGHTDHEYVYDGKGILYSKHVLTVDKVVLSYCLSYGLN